MSIWLRAIPLAVLFGCASQNLPKSYELKPETGVLYSRVNSINYGLYLTLLFENAVTREMKEHTVNRSAMDSRDTFIVAEMNPGRWIFKTITLSTVVPGQSEFHPIKDTFNIELEIKKGAANYFPEITFKEDCDIPLVSSAGSVSKDACKKYEIGFKYNKRELDSVLAKRYPKIRPDESDSGAVIEKKYFKYHKAGVFGETYVNRTGDSFHGDAANPGKMFK